jgi:hypothetical protein
LKTLLLHESLSVDGARQTVELGVEGESLLVIIDGEAKAIPREALDHVMDRYGKPLEAGTALTGPTLDLGHGVTLQTLRHKTFFDVIARDFVVLTRPGKEPLCELSTAISAVLAHLAHAVAEE